MSCPPHSINFEKGVTFLQFVLHNVAKNTYGFVGEKINIEE